MAKFTFDLLIKRLAGKKAEASGKDEYQLVELGKFYLDIGDVEKALEIYTNLGNQYEQGRFMTRILSAGLPYQEKIPGLFYPVIQKHEYLSGRFRLINELLAYSLKHKQVQPAELCLAKLKQIYRNLDPDDVSYYWILLIPNVNSLVNIGLAEEGEAIIRGVETFLKSADMRDCDRAWIETRLIKQYIALHRPDDFQRILSLLLKHPTQITFLDELLLHLMDHGFQMEAQSIIDALCREYTETTLKPPIEDAWRELDSFQKIHSSELIREMLLRSPSFETIVANIERNIEYNVDRSDVESRFNFRVEHMNYIKFMMRFNFVETAEKIANKLDLVNGGNTFKEIFHYNLYLKIPDDSTGIPFIKTQLENIETLPNEYKLHIFLKAANKLWQHRKPSDAVKMMDRAHQTVIAMKKEGYEYPRLVLPQANHCCLLWIQMGFPQKAMDLIPFLTREDNKDLILFRVMQFHVLHSDEETIQQAMRWMEQSPGYLDLARSKLAARLFLMGKEREAVNLFKEIISSELQRNHYILYRILKNYRSVSENRQIFYDEIVPVVHADL